MKDQLASYAALLRKFAPRVNLISPGDLEHLESRHLRDSLRLAPLLEILPPGPLVDIGSGAGLPGIPLAIARPERHWVLVEPRQKRAAFLEEVVRELGLDASVVALRAEDLARDPAHRATYALACARALAEPPRAFGLLLPFVVPGGIAAVFLGDRAPCPPDAEVWEKGIAIVRPGDPKKGRDEPGF